MYSCLSNVSNCWDYGWWAFDEMENFVCCFLFWLILCHLGLSKKIKLKAGLLIPLISFWPIIIFVICKQALLLIVLWKFVGLYRGTFGTILVWRFCWIHKKEANYGVVTPYFALMCDMSGNWHWFIIFYFYFFYMTKSAYHCRHILISQSNVLFVCFSSREKKPSTWSIGLMCFWHSF
jgi:hypothetical protein